MITFTIPAFILILFAIAIAGVATGAWMTLFYEAPKNPQDSVLKRRKK